MRKIILSLNITEDGFIAGPHGELDWHFPFWNSEMCESLCRLLSRADTLLLGRKTYEALSAYWESSGPNLTAAKEDIVLADRMNRYFKIVVSSTLNTLHRGNSCLITKRLSSSLQKFKEEEGMDIIILGSAQLVSQLIKHQLIDEYQIWLHPVNIGTGKRIAGLKDFRTSIEPVEREIFSTGVLRLRYIVSS